MKFLKNNWFWILLVLLMLIALWTANRALMFLIAAVATAYLFIQKIANPTYWAVTALAWLLGLLWGSSFMQGVYGIFTGSPPQNTGQTFPNVTGGNNG